jgi:hypothetical protein
MPKIVVKIGFYLKSQHSSRSKGLKGKNAHFSPMIGNKQVDRVSDAVCRTLRDPDVTDNVRLTMYSSRMSDQMIYELELASGSLTDRIFLDRVPIQANSANLLIGDTEYHISHLSKIQAERLQALLHTATTECRNCLKTVEFTEPRLASTYARRKGNIYKILARN